MKRKSPLVFKEYTQGQVVLLPTDLGDALYQYQPKRTSHANSSKPKSMPARFEEIIFKVSRVLEGGLYLNSLEKGLRSENALMQTLTEIYIQDVSKRKVIAIIELLFEIDLSSIQVSQADVHLEQLLEAQFNRALGEILQLSLNVPHENVREEARSAIQLCCLQQLQDGKANAAF